jgi:hypothetical protein
VEGPAVDSAVASASGFAVFRLAALPLFHSYLNDSVGCNFDALFAGNHPNNTPVAHDTSNETNIDHGEIGMCRFMSAGINAPAMIANPTAIAIPITAPTPLMNSASTRNW